MLRPALQGVVDAVVPEDLEAEALMESQRAWVGQGDVALDAHSGAGGVRDEGGNQSGAEAAILKSGQNRNIHQKKTRRRTIHPDAASGGVLKGDDAVLGIRILRLVSAALRLELHPHQRLQLGRREPPLDEIAHADRLKQLEEEGVILGQGLAKGMQRD
jgi:hypothetical protein